MENLIGKKVLANGIFDGETVKTVDTLRNIKKYNDWDRENFFGIPEVTIKRWKARGRIDSTCLVVVTISTEDKYERLYVIGDGVYTIEGHITEIERKEKHNQKINSEITQLTAEYNQKLQELQSKLQ